MPIQFDIGSIDYRKAPEPTQNEIMWHLEYGHISGLGFQHKCPFCRSTKTNWIRNMYHLCFDCEMVFTTCDALLEDYPELYAENCLPDEF